MRGKTGVTPEFHGADIKAVQHGKLQDTPIETIDRYLRELKAHQLEWARTYPLSGRIKLLEQVLSNIDTYEEEWAQGDLQARHIPDGHFDGLNSYLGGPAIAARLTRSVIEVLQQMEEHGGHKPFAKARQDGDRVIVESFPLSVKDRMVFTGWRGEIHLEKGTTVESLPNLQAKYYKDESYEGGVSLVLVAGNISFLAFSDLYAKLINEKKVVVMKIHPVLEYMGSILTKVLEPFIAEGFVRIVIGGSAVGQYLTDHPLVDDIQLTGSDKTFETIVYGGGEQGQKNKAEDHRINSKPVTGELGNVTPVIVIPGDWKESDFDYQADNILCMLSIFNGYTCAAARVLILPKFWDGSRKLVEKLEARMAGLPLPINYYPGTESTIKDAIACYPHMNKVGELSKTTQPWMLATDLDSKKDEIAFSREFWASFMAQTYVDGSDEETYLRNAVKFANEKLWGTLSAILILDHKTEKALMASGALRKAIDDLRYGTVAINSPSAFGLALGANPWGGYPGSTYNDIQSGNGFVTNPFMLDKVEKSVIYAPFRIFPRPIWFASTKPNLGAAKALTKFFISNKLADFGRLMVSMIRH